MRNWRDTIPETERQRLARAGYGRAAEDPARLALALLVVDVTYDFTGPPGGAGPEDGWPLACGAAAWDAVAVIAEVVGAFRARALPVVFTTAQYLRLGGWTSWDALAPGIESRDPRVVDELGVRDSDVVLTKGQPSAFFGTPLASMLLGAGVQGVAVVGGTTSGCVRATVVDAFSHGLRTWVLEDAVFDRSELSHAVSLFDMEQKYAPVLPAATFCSRLANPVDVRPAGNVVLH